MHASNQEEAKECVLKHCGLVIGEDIHSTLPPDEVSWDFKVHPEKKVVSVRTFIQDSE